jgi:hypothetical protein
MFKIPLNFTGSARSLARSFIPKFIKAGWSRNFSLNWLKERGHGVRKTNFLKDWAQIAGLAQKKDRFKYIPKSKKPDQGTITPSDDKQMNFYKLTYESEVEDVLTGNREKITFSLGLDELPTMGEADLMADVIAGNIIQSDSPKKGITPGNYEVRTISMVGITKSTNVK